MDHATFAANSQDGPPAPTDLADHGDDREAFGRDMVAGLTAPRKQTKPKYLYDERGAQLFEQICELDEYYPTRTEIALLRGQAGDIARSLGPQATLIEFGSGATVKIRILLDALERPAAYVPVDISREQLIANSHDLAAQYPELTVVPICADYTRPLPLPAEVADQNRVAFFPGSTIGNLMPDEALAFLAAVRQTVGDGGSLLIGVDLRKDPAVLRAAYNDASGVTADFNLNLLARANRELGADFDLEAFRHEAVYEPDKGRIEMRLYSRRPQTVTIGDAAIPFAEGEFILTEVSHKYSVAGFQDLAARAGWRAKSCWTDAQDYFSLHHLTAA